MKFPADDNVDLNTIYRKLCKIIPLVEIAKNILQRSAFDDITEIESSFFFICGANQSVFNGIVYLQMLL
jgi:hypothetical protein